jgi:hypothetical protein
MPTLQQGLGFIPFRLQHPNALDCPLMSFVAFLCRADLSRFFAAPIKTGLLDLVR